jgi:hypothetical protein
MWHTYHILRAFRHGGLTKRLLDSIIKGSAKTRQKNTAFQYQNNPKYREKFDRIQNAIQLKPVDRPPVAFEYDILSARYAGITAKEYFYNQKLGNAKYLETNKYFDFDGVFFPFAGFGALAKLVDLKFLNFPGTGGVPEDRMYQFVEKIYMDPEDYAPFLADGTKFFGKKLLPQLMGLFQKNWLSFGFSILKLIVKINSFTKNLAKTLNQLEADGTVVFCGSLSGYSGAPYDYLADFFRGLRGISRDIHKNPDQVKLLADKFEPYMVVVAKLLAEAAGSKNIFMPLHRGDANFLSLRQFEEFYWPSFKRLLLDLIDLGYVPMPSFEGYWTKDHFELFRNELPKGKIIFNLDGPTDIFMAHDILARHSCIMGNVPHQLLVIGNPDEVKSYCRKIIESLPEGLILAPGIGLPEDSKLENVRALVEVAKEAKK